MLITVLNGVKTRQGDLVIYLGPDLEEWQLFCPPAGLHKSHTFPD